MPENKLKVTIVSVYRREEDRNEFANYKGIRLVCIAGKVYDKILIESVQKK